MKLFSNKIYVAAAMAVLAGAWQGAAAQSIRLSGVSADGVIHGTLDRAGKTVSAVRTYAYSMDAGGSYTSAQVEYTLSGNDIQAPVTYTAGANVAYRMEVTFSDNSRVVSECIDPQRTYAFMWLTDYATTSQSAGSGTPQYDHCAEGGCSRNVFGGIAYTKQVSTHGSGHMQWTLPAGHSFTRFVTIAAMEDAGTEGDAQFIIQTNGTTVFNERIVCRNKPGRGSLPTQFSVDIPMRGVSTLRWNVEDGPNGQNWGDHGHLLVPRLYLDMRADADITFGQPGGAWPVSTPGITLSATASSGQPVTFSIAQGANLAQLVDGNRLVPNFNAKGRVVVAAQCPETETHKAGYKELAYDMDLGTWAEYLGSYTEPDGAAKAFYSVNTRIWQVDQLVCEYYDNELSLTKTGEVDLAANLPENGTDRECIVVVPMPSGDRNLWRLRMLLHGTTDYIYTPYTDGTRDIVYATDLSVTPVGSATVGVDAPVCGNNNGRLRIQNQYYGKGVAVSGNGTVRIGTAGSLDGFVRFRAELGEQQASPASISGGAGQYYFSAILSSEPGGTRHINYGGQEVNPNQRFNIDFNTIKGRYLQLALNYINGREIVLGGARFYTAPRTVTKEAQSLQWVAEQAFTRYEPYTVQLDATASSGLPVFYRILSGAEYATVDGSVLRVHTIPDGNMEIVVQAMQPGSRGYAAATPRQCVFRNKRGLVVQANEKAQVTGHNVMEEIVIYGNKNQVGQVSVKDGLLNARRLTLKYTFVPGEWNYLVFPSDVDLNAVSNLGALGYTLNANVGGSYQVQSYETSKMDANETPWTDATAPRLAGRKGYIMRLGTELGTEPVEVTFGIDNVRLDLESTVRPLFVNLDMMRTEPGTSTTVYIKGANVKSNTLKVNVVYSPENADEVPLNHAIALRDMRLVSTPDGTGLRLTLPTQDVATVAFYNIKGTKVHKAVRYAAPGIIDLSDLRPGRYRVLIKYGPAIEERTYTVKR